MITPYRIRLDPLDVSCNYPKRKKHFSEKELLKRGDFVREEAIGRVIWYHYITEEEFKRLWKPNIFYYIQDPLLEFYGTWDIEWTESYEDIF